MKLHRFAAAVATAAIAPAALLSSTAAAADVKAPGVSAPDQGARPNSPADNADSADSAPTPSASPAPDPARPADGAPTDGKPSGDGMDTDGHGWRMQGTTVAINGPATYKAGGGWSDVELTVNNHHGRSFNGLVVLPMAKGVKMGDLRLQFRGPDGVWRDAEKFQQSDHFDVHFHAEGKSDHLYQLAAGDVLTIELRLRFAPGAAAAHGWLAATAMPVGAGDIGGYKVSNRYEFTVLPAHKKPTTEGDPLPVTGHGSGPTKPKGDGDKATTSDATSGVTPLVHKSTDTSDTGTSGAAQASSADHGTATDDDSTATGAQLAATGADPAAPWALGGGAVAFTAGTGLVLAARRRAAADR